MRRDTLGIDFPPGMNAEGRKALFVDGLLQQAEALRKLSQTDPDYRIRERAEALYLIASGRTIPDVAKEHGHSMWQVAHWYERFLAEGLTGLADRPRSGRPPVLNGEALRVLEAALAGSPTDYGYRAEDWSITNLRDLLRSRGWHVGYETVSRALRKMGYRHRLVRG
jgi:transposase